MEDENDVPELNPPEVETPVTEGVTETNISKTAEEFNIKFTPAELEAAKASLFQQQQPAIDHDRLSEALKNAISPLVPKAPEPARPWTDPKSIENFESFQKAMDARFQHEIEQFKNTMLTPLQQELAQVKGLLPEFYAYAAANPAYNQVNTRAAELQKNYGLNRMQALRMAQDEAARAPVKQAPKPQVPGHMSTPDTRPNSGEVDDDKGPADFRDIVRQLKATGKY